MGDRWSGHAVRQARAYWSPRVEAGGVRCSKCGKPINKGQVWHVDHLIPREFGGQKLGLGNTWPAHERCNTSAGGKRGAELTNGKKKKVVNMKTMKPKSERGIRGV